MNPDHHQPVRNDAGTPEVDARRSMTRHAVAALVYRATKVLRGAPPDFGGFRVSPTTRTPLEILAHMGDLFDWALSLAEGAETWRDTPPQEWAGEVSRFFISARRFDAYLATHESIACTCERLLQGPIADAITHTGQLAMIRRIAGTPIRGENYFKADIAIGHLGAEQPPPRKEFD